MFQLRSLQPGCSLVADGKPSHNLYLGKTNTEAQDTLCPCDGDERLLLNGILTLSSPPTTRRKLYPSKQDLTEMRTTYPWTSWIWVAYGSCISRKNPKRLHRTPSTLAFYTSFLNVHIERNALPMKKPDFNCVNSSHANLSSSVLLRRIHVVTSLSLSSLGLLQKIP